MKHLRKAIVALAAAAATNFASAGSVLITFEGLADGAFGAGFNAISPVGVNFTNYFTAAIDSDAGGGAATQNQFANAPSGITAAFATSSGGGGPFINFSATYYEISFWYTAADTGAPPTPSINVTDMNGNVTTVTLPFNNSPTPTTAATCAGTPVTDTYSLTYGLCNWTLVSFVSAVPLQSVDFANANNRILIDNVTLVPEPASLALLSVGLLAIGVARRRKA